MNLLHMLGETTGRFVLFVASQFTTIVKGVHFFAANPYCNPKKMNDADDDALTILRKRIGLNRQVISVEVKPPAKEDHYPWITVVRLSDGTRSESYSGKATALKIKANLL